MRAILSTVTLAVGAVAHLSRAPGPFMNSHLAPLPADPASTCALAFSLGGFNFNVSSLQLPTGEVWWWRACRGAAFRCVCGNACLCELRCVYWRVHGWVSAAPGGTGGDSPMLEYVAAAAAAVGCLTSEATDEWPVPLGSQKFFAWLRYPGRRV